MASRSGAKKDFTKEIKEEEELQRDIKVYQEEKAKTEKVQHKDSSIFSKALNTLSVVCLLIIAFLALITMFGSPDIDTYNINKEVFHKYAFICTLCYFVFAYWGLRRKKALIK